MNLPQNIRTRRKKLGLTQLELADAAGLSEWSVGRIERGELTPCLKTVARLAKVLRTTVSKLVE